MNRQAAVAGEFDKEDTAKKKLDNLYIACKVVFRCFPRNYNLGNTTSISAVPVVNCLLVNVQ